MPVRRKRDKQGCYYQYGNHGKKYYYVIGNKQSRENARLLSVRQAQAINISKKKED